jgi:hypothetical protein
MLRLHDGSVKEGGADDKREHHMENIKHLRVADRPWDTRCGADATADDLTNRAALAIIDKHPEAAQAALSRFNICRECFKTFSSVLIRVMS